MLLLGFLGLWTLMCYLHLLIILIYPFFHDFYDLSILLLRPESYFVNPVHPVVLATMKVSSRFYSLNSLLLLYYQWKNYWIQCMYTQQE